MTSRFRVLTVAITTLVLAAPHVRLSAEGQKMDALIGTWVLNVPKSKMNPPPKSQVRTFDYTKDGMVMCTLSGESGNGNWSFFHWYTNLDGVQHPEFNRSAGATSTTTIALKKIDDHSVEIKGVTMASGKTHLTGSATISADGKTMTWTTKNINLATGAENDQVRIYEKR